MSKGVRLTNGHATIRVEIDDDRLRDLWHSDLPIMDVCWALNAFHTEVLARARKLGLGKRAIMPQVEEPPTPQEIEERCAEIRRLRWTDEEYYRRASAGCRWEPRTTTFSLPNNRRV